MQIKFFARVKPLSSPDFIGQNIWAIIFRLTMSEKKLLKQKYPPNLTMLFT